MVTVATDESDSRGAADGAPADARVPVDLHVRIGDPFDAYGRVRHGRGGEYRATTGGQSGWGNVGVDPVDRPALRPDAAALANPEDDARARRVALGVRK